MTSFLQMSHNSLALLREDWTKNFGGAVLSPVNAGVEATAEAVSRMRLRRASDFYYLLDPQLYYPESQRGTLGEWSFFPEDFATGDRSSLDFWSKITAELANVGKHIRAHGVASPSWVPKVYSRDYYRLLVELGRQLAQLAGYRFEPVQSVIVNLRTLHDLKEVMTVASIVTETTCPLVYLLVEAEESNPRRELDDENLLHVMQLIQLIERSGRRVLVGYTSSDVVLWKAAGATSTATGNFFNVRRFTPSRFEAGPAGGGPGAAYWFEPALLAYIRQGDLLRLKAASLLSSWTLKHKLLPTVLKKIERQEAWIAEGWREYLSWYQKIERDLGRDNAAANGLIASADSNWKAVAARKIYMEEGPVNAGDWLTSWQKAVSDFSGWIKDLHI